MSVECAYFVSNINRIEKEIRKLCDDINMVIQEDNPYTKERTMQKIEEISKQICAKFDERNGFRNNLDKC